MQFLHKYHSGHWLQWAYLCWGFPVPIAPTDSCPRTSSPLGRASSLRMLRYTFPAPTPKSIKWIEEEDPLQFLRLSYSWSDLTSKSWIPPNFGGGSVSQSKGSCVQSLLELVSKSPVHCTGNMSHGQYFVGNNLTGMLLWRSSCNNGFPLLSPPQGNC